MEWSEWVWGRELPLAARGICCKTASGAAATCHSRHFRMALILILLSVNLLLFVTCCFLTDPAPIIKNVKPFDQQHCEQWNAALMNRQRRSKHRKIAKCHSPSARRASADPPSFIFNGRHILFLRFGPIIALHNAAVRSLNGINAF